MRKWMWILLGVVFLLISSIAYVWIDMYNSEREEMTLDQLLIKEPILPKEWKDGNGEIHRSNWDKKESFIVNEGITKRGSSYNKTFFWNDKRDGNKNTSTGIHFYVYDSPWEAKWSYEWWRPERVEFFMPNTKEEELYPENFPYESPFADDQKVLCAAGEFDGCVNWIYWARYGQYLVEIKYDSLDAKGMDMKTFQNLMQPMEEHVGERLKKKDFPWWR